MWVFFPPFFLILTVLGTILLGAASPTEAAGCGACGALLIAYLKGKLDFKTLKESCTRTTTITSMVFMLLIGAQFFGVVFRGLYGDDLIKDLVLGFADNPNFILITIMVFIFILGFFLDFLEICFIVVPIILPIIQGLEYPTVWVAILIAVNLQTSFLTPPFGFALFYLKGVAPKEVTTMHLYKGIIPFVGVQMFVLFLLYLFPELTLYLPRIVFGN